MQHVSLAVGGWGQAGQRWSHGCQGEMEMGCAAGEGHGGAAGRSGGQMGGGASSVLLRFQLSLAAAHGCDEGGPLAAAVLGKQEVDVTLWGEFLYRLLEDPREAEGKEQQEAVVRRRLRNERCFLVRASDAAFPEALQSG